MALLGVYALGVSQNLDVLHTQLQIAQERSDVQVVYVHWGEEYQATHSTAQRQLAEALSALGVHAIIGHHPHVVQDIEIIGDTLVFYSLGNFVFDQYFSDEVEDGLIVELALVDNTLEYQLYGVSSQGSRSRPQLLPQYDADRFLERLAKKSDASLQAEIRRGVITQYIQ